MAATFSLNLQQPVTLCQTLESSGLVILTTVYMSELDMTTLHYWDNTGQLIPSATLYVYYMNTQQLSICL